MNLRAPLQPLLFDAVAQDGADVLDQTGEPDRRVFQRQLAGLDLGQIEYGVDDFEQVVARVLDHVQALGLLRRHAGAPHDMHHAGDGVQRGSNFVAHVGQKSTLGL